MAINDRCEASRYQLRSERFDSSQGHRRRPWATEVQWGSSFWETKMIEDVYKIDMSHMIHDTQYIIVYVDVLSF